MSLIHFIFKQGSYAQMTIKQVNAVDKLREIEGISIQTVWREIRLSAQPHCIYIKYVDDKNNTLYSGKVNQNQNITWIKTCKEGDWLESRLCYIAEQLSKE